MLEAMGGVSIFRRKGDNACRGNGFRKALEGRNNMSISKGQALQCTKEKAKWWEEMRPKEEKRGPHGPFKRLHISGEEADWFRSFKQSAGLGFGWLSLAHGYGTCF